MANRILTKLSGLNTKLTRIERLVNKEEGELTKIEKEERSIEKQLLKIGNITLRKSHLLEIAKAIAGAFFGAGLNYVVFSSSDLASRLPWVNIVGMLLFILIMVSIIIYKNEISTIREARENLFSYIGIKIIKLYTIAILVQIAGLFLFNIFPGWNLQLIKVLIIGSYATISAAVAFSYI